MESESKVDGNNWVVSKDKVTIGDLIYESENSIWSAQESIIEYATHELPELLRKNRR